MSDSLCQPNVLHVNTARTWRGGEQQMLYLLRGLLQRGLRAEAVCQPGSPAAVRARRAGAVVHEISMRMEADPLAAFRLARLARRGAFDILHAHTAHAHGIIWPARHLFSAGCRIVVHRRIAFEVGRAMFGLGRMKYRFGVNAYIAVSDYVKDSLIKVGIAPWRIFRVRSVTDPDRFTKAAPNPSLRRELGIPQDAYVIGNVAYLVPHKDHNNLLEAAGVATGEIPNLWVVIVGKGQLRDQILRKARELGLADRLVLTGFRDDIPQLTRMFDLFALSSYQEGMSGALLEAMAGGCPVVATDAAGNREAVLDGTTGLIVPVKNPAALAAGIVRMATDPDFARSMAEAGRERVVRHFTVDALTEKTLAVYRRVLAGQVGPEYPVTPEP